MDTDTVTGPSSLYVLGARQRRRILKREEEWNLYESAVLLRVEPETGWVEACLEHRTPPEARAHGNSSNAFKSTTIAGDKLFTCTSTEVLILKLPDFELIGYVSLPSFNDLHHVRPSQDGNLLVVSTGLDMVIKCTPEGKTLQEWCVLEEEPWSRFSQAIDYRRVGTTKPHQSHPNHVFELNGQVWATRFRQKDAICLEDRSKRIDIAVQFPHDGLLFDGEIYFTTVDGRIVTASPQTFEVKRVIDLRTFQDSTLLGWCRGLLPVDSQRIWVAYTRVRKTKFMENILWAKSLLTEGAPELPTRIVLYDVVEKRSLREINLETHGLNSVFSILPATSEEIRDTPRWPAEVRTEAAEELDLVTSG